MRHEAGIIVGKGNGRLQVIATPIGNLADLSARAREALLSADVIAAEDTRHTRVLLSALGIAKPLVSLHEHNESQRTPQLLARLAAGETDRKSTRLNSSHGYISYAVFCLKKKMYDETRRSATCRPSCICVHGRM